ncbi:hypothetical protein C8J56DRAFT_860838 [Mycena floridula]|nr:hypothetical protein C8J56DRAFT_860838 [Mycena floridula]
MVQITSTLLLAIAAVSINAAPVTLNKRIAQVIADSTAKWEQACLAAGGAQQCNPVSITAFTTLLAAAGPCEQQDAADAMIDLAKTLNNDPTMITLTQIFVQQPRNSPNSVAIPYCQTAPKNSELNGLFQCQFQGSNQNTFVGGVAVGGAGTIPFGKTAPLNPLGSCPANPSGPIADGVQLNTLVTSPGTGSSSGTGSAATTEAAVTTAATKTAAATTAAATTAASSSGSGSSTSFQLQNALDAQALNAKFASLTADSTCTDGEQACVAGAFAQCVGGKFSTTSCGALQCVALPLVNKAGTSITCDTEADAIARIQAAGGSASLTGDGSAAPSTGSATDSAADPDCTDDATTDAGTGTVAVSTPATGSSSGDFKLQNAKDAQALNAKFASLTAGSTCTDGEQACVGGGFAQCVGGKFAVTGCSAPTVCVALPLVNKAGTSITCDTEADAIARMSAAGASASLTG